MSRYYITYKQRVSLHKKIHIVTGNNFGKCVSKYSTFILSLIRYQQVRKCANDATFLALSFINWHYTNFDQFRNKGKCRKQKKIFNLRKKGNHINKNYFNLQ